MQCTLLGELLTQVNQFAENCTLHTLRRGVLHQVPCDFFFFFFLVNNKVI